ncbi:hypothetical protein GQ53DRAFT_752776 [Thozetella sp. PMI_491]|nr:hypothetical protein GQ53DRAFT_752776 [Thozetella sp. PMI_491]
MASGLFSFDPLVALRVAPLVSSSCTLFFAWNQHFFLSLLNRPEDRKLTKAYIPIYFPKFFAPGTVVVLVFLTATISSSTANLYTQRAALEASGSFVWYAAGAVLAASHLLFIPAVAPHVQTIYGADEKTDVHGALGSWLSANFARMVTVDLLAWVACTFAVIKTVRV